jgi:hypothetical protein
MKLLTHSSAKLIKSSNDKWVTRILYLEPEYGKLICPGATKGCKQSCLVYSGRMRMANAVIARERRTNWYLAYPQSFIQQLNHELTDSYRYALKKGKRLAVRLNGTSDIDWFEVYSNHPNIQFVEYTKRANLARKLAQLPNVDVTMSRHEKHNPLKLVDVLESGGKVSVVFNDKQSLPETWMGYPVIDGDLHDRRFEDGAGVVVGLKLKGTLEVKAKAIESGFAVTL